jgi:release factor glutamine methyltransferase
MPPERAAHLLREGRRLLEQAHIGSAALDARLLLQEASSLSHEDLIGDPERLLEERAAAGYRAMIARRITREPVSRILGRREFYGRVFTVTSAVLDPRSDTETLVEAALSILPVDQPREILDLGTGSGAIIVTLLAERPKAQGVASDLSPAALEVARSNAIHHGVEQRLRFVEASWFQGVPGSFDLIVSNPPYIPHGAIGELEPEVREFDPKGALDGGPDGCEAYRRIAVGVTSHLAPNGRILVEIGGGQVDAVAAIFYDHGFAAGGQWNDLGGRIRCLGFGR